MKLKDAIVVITGASSGIGAETAALLSAKGAVPVLVARSRGKLEQAAGRLSGPYGLYVCDVADGEQVRRTFDEILKTYGRIDILLNNAGYGKFAALSEMEEDEFARMMDVNYMGIVRCTKAVLPSMLERRHGQIVNVASMAGKIGSAKSVSYTATKHAVLGFTNALRQELRHSGIVVSAVNPGPISTEFFDLADPTGNYVNNVRGFMMTPQYVSSRMVKLMEKNKEELDLPYIAAAAIRLYGLFPRLADKLTYGLMNKK